MENLISFIIASRNVFVKRNRSLCRVYENLSGARLPNHMEKNAELPPKREDVRKR